jgi:hypothetical protein
MSESLFSAEQIKIPSDLPEIMKNYTKYVIKNQPQDIISASAEYFSRLSKQKSSSPSKRLDKVQLEAFYNKFKSKEKVSQKEITDLAEELHISASVSDILGSFKGDAIPWLNIWSNLLAASTGSLVATIELLADIAGDSGNVSISIVTEVVQYLSLQDKSINADQLSSFLGKLGDTGSKDIGIESLKELAQEEFAKSS